MNIPLARFIGALLLVTVLAGCPPMQTPDAGDTDPTDNREIKVPFLVGQSLTQAESANDAADLILGGRTRETSDTVPVDQVIRQTPEGGVRVAPNTSVSLVLSSGPEMTVVPLVASSTQADAELEIRSAGLTLGNIREEFSRTVPAGHVIGQEPRGGTSLPMNTPVVLIVSKGPAITVPNLVGTGLSDATEQLESAGLVAGTVTVAYSDIIPVAQVMSQNPAAGQSASSGAAVAMVVSGGTAPVPTPTLTGLTQAAAENALVSVGLRLGTVGEIYSETVAVGRVVSQDPASAEALPPNSAVHIVLSLGPEPITVPDISNRTQSQAESELSELRLVLGTVTEAFSSTVLEGRVIRQEPEAGATLLPGGEVSVVLSKGIQLLTVPDVAGTSRATAESRIVNGGFALGTVTEAYSDTIAQGLVISQNPLANTMAPGGSNVTILLSKGPETSELNETVQRTGSELSLDDITLTIPAEAVENPVAITLSRNMPGDRVDRGSNDREVSQVYRLEQDSMTALESASASFTFRITYDAQQLPVMEGELLNDLTLFLRVTTADASFRLAGTLTEGGFELPLDVLPESATVQLVYNPGMREVFSDAPASKAVTQNAPWQTTRFRCTYDVNSADLLQALALAESVPLSEVTEDTVRESLRTMVANNARDAALLCESLGLRAARLRVVPASPAHIDVHVDAYPDASHFVPRSTLWNQLSVDTNRFNPVDGDPLGSIRNAIAHELFHASINGYALDMGPNDVYAAGVVESLGALVGRYLQEGAIALQDETPHLLSDTLGLAGIECDDTDCTYTVAAYGSIDWFAYIGTRFDGGTLRYLGGVDAGGNSSSDGLLEQLRQQNVMASPTDSEAALLQLRHAMQASFDALFDQPLGEVYWDYARNRAYERNDESRLREGDRTLERYTLNEALFASEDVQRFDFSSDEQVLVVSSDDIDSLRAIPPLSTRAVVFKANGFNSDVHLRFDREGWTPDEFGNSVMVKVYKSGFNGIELDADEDTISLTGFGDSEDEATVDEIVVLVSNLSIDTAHSVSLEATTTIATGGLGALAGRITNAATEAPLSDVAISIRGRNIGDNDDIIATATSDANGQFSFEELPSGYVEFSFESAGFIETVQTATVIADLTTQMNATLLVAENTGVIGHASGRVIDNVSGTGIDGVTLSLRRGILRGRDLAYPVAATTMTDGSGDYALNDLSPGTYTAFATREGYVDATFVIYIVGDATVTEQNGDMSTTVNIGEIRIVLTWGERPSDLDSHLTGPSASGRFHIYFVTRTAGTADLDLDDVSSFGPETTTIRSRSPGTYRFSVHDYSNLSSGSSVAMSNSGAKVRVITEFGTTEFNITPNTPATLWTVLEIDGVTGAITEVDEYSFTSNPSAVSKSLGWRYGLGSEVPSTIGRNLPPK